MNDLLPFIVIGLTSGSVYALAGMGLVVTYKTSGIFNFAQGALAMFCTFLFYSLYAEADLPAWFAVPVVVLVIAPILGAAIDRLILRRLVGATAATYVVVSLGLLVALQGLIIVMYGAESRQLGSFLPDGTFRLPGVNVTWEQLIIVLVAGAAAVGLGLFFRYTRLGLQMRAVVDDGDLSELTGTDARWVRTVSWMIGTSFAALSGVLLAPSVGLDAAILTLLVAQAFGAAVVGRLTSVPLAYAGGLFIGLVGAISTKYVADYPTLAGLPPSLPFIVLFAVLVLSPRGRFSEVTKVRQREGARVLAATRRLPWPVLAVGLAALVVLPYLISGSRVLTLTSTVIFVLIFRSLGLLVGLSRQVSLCHAVFVALGATNLSKLLESDWPLGPAMVLAAVLVVPIGAIVAIPAIRLSGLFLALATFGFGVLAQYLVFGTDFAFGDDATVLLSRPDFFGIALNGDKAFYFFVLAAVVVGLVAIELVASSRLGRLLRALADSPTAVDSIGVRPTSSRVLVFCISAFFAALSGGLLGLLFRSVNTVSFDFFQSLIWLTVLVTAGAATLGGAVLGAALFIAVPAVWTAPEVTEYQPLFFGVAAMLLAQTPNGIAGFFRRPDFDVLAAKSSWRRERSRSKERRMALEAAG